jgi:hypothetical protein
MKAFKAICTVAVLALALSVPTYAGEVLTPGFTSPLPAAPIATVPGEIGTPGVLPTSPGDGVIPGLLGLLVAIISIF